MTEELTDAQRANMDVVRAGLEAYNDGDPAAALPFIHPEVVVYTAPMMGNAGTYAGHEGYLRWMNLWEEAWDEFHIEVVEMIPVGEDDIVAAVHQTGRGAGSGIEVEMDSALHSRIRDAQMIRIGFYPDTEQAHAAARASD